MPTTEALRAIVVLLWGGCFLSGCATRLTYADTQATAIVTGCWPDGYPTPVPITLTPLGVPTLTPVGATAQPDRPTVTMLPSTTALPRCVPPPGATAVPWPTPVPNPPPFPTIEPALFSGGGAQHTALLLPTNVLNLDIATHPTEGWPALASVVWSSDQDPTRIMANVLNPGSATWSSAHQVDLGPARIGNYSRTAQIAITGDRTVYVVWAMSDPDFQDNDPPSGTWIASSTDYGATWSSPQRIAIDCRAVQDVTATLDGYLVVLLTCDNGPHAARASVLVRNPDGVWHRQEHLAVPLWQYSDGAVVITGMGQERQIVALSLAGGATPQAYLMMRQLTGGTWTIQRRAIAGGSEPIGLRMWHASGISYQRAGTDRLQAITFTWAAADQPMLFALTSLDGGTTWGAPEVVAGFPGQPMRILFGPVGYDQAADRLVVIAQCCADAGWTEVPSTHYARWSVPGSAVWQSPGGEAPDRLIALALGGRAVSTTVMAQAQGSRVTWLAWKEALRRVEVRSVQLNQLIPIDQYPAPTALPTAVGG